MAHEQLLHLARTVAIDAGRLASLRRTEGIEVAATKSSPVDVVTAADREVEAFIRSVLADARPGDGFLGEESGAGDSSTGLTWVVDPIDGTVNYLYGIPHYAVSVAVVEGAPDPSTWSALAGCVYNPSTGETFTGVVGGGAFCDGESIGVAASVDLSQALIATGFAYDSDVRAQQGRIVAGLLPLVRDVRRLGTASLDLCFVAAGRCNAYFERTLSPWDHAAGALIAREAGAVVKGWGGERAGRDLVLAGHPDVIVRLEAALDTIGR